MALGSSVAQVVVIWATILISQVAVITDTFVAASVISRVRIEKEALLNAGWWNDSREKANNPSDHCMWAGIVCNSDGSIIRISLTGVDSIKGDLGQLNSSCLSNLESLRIQFLYLSGSMPSEIGVLSKLQELHLSSNNLIGSIPSTIGNLTKLVSLDLSVNQLNGLLPREVGKMKNLVSLSLSHNNLIGPIPSTLGHLTNLTSLELDYNQLNGSIPSELMNCSKLKILRLSNNHLGGSIPSEIGNLKELKDLYLSYNSSSGRIPFQLGEIPHICNLDLSRNCISGTIPESVRKVPHLVSTYNNLLEKMPNTSENSPLPQQFKSNKDKPQKIVTRLLVIILPIILFLTIVLEYCLSIGEDIR